jgi:hypothetical protein
MQYVFRSFLEINTVLHLVFDLSIRGQVPGNVFVILKVPNAVLGVKACNEVGDRVLKSLWCLDVNAKVLVLYIFETIFVCFLSIFYKLAHLRIKGTSLLCIDVLVIGFGHNSCPIRIGSNTTMNHQDLTQPWTFR